MKKIFTLLVMVALAACWVSCSDDDNDNENFGKNGKRLIREMHTEHGYEFFIKFDYDKDGYITKIENVYYKEICTISRQEKKVTYYYDGELSEISTLNDKGYVISEDYWDQEKWRKEYTYEYDNSGQMIKEMDYETEDGTIYTWKDGNIISKEYTDQEDSAEYEYYTEYENKSNIDLAQILYLWEDGISIADYCGKISKNLLKSCTHTGSYWERYEYEYEFDEKGYVSTIKEYLMKGGNKKLNQLYHITYVE